MAQPATLTKSKQSAPKRKKPRTEAVEVAYLPPPVPNDLPSEDDEPLESDWHLMQIYLLHDLIAQLWEGRTDYFAGANMFIYYSAEQAESVIRKRPLYKGPDFFVVKDVDGTKERSYWNVWYEGGRYPDVIFELSSPSTAKKDREENLVLYAKTFGTPEYFIYDPTKQELLGYRLKDGDRAYVPIEPNERGWLWSEQLEVWVGIWEGTYRGRPRKWVRWWTREGELIPTPFEAQQTRAEQAERALEDERKRAEQLAQRLRELGIDPDTV